MPCKRKKRTGNMARQRVSKTVGFHASMVRLAGVEACQSVARATRKKERVIILHDLQRDARCLSSYAKSITAR